MHQFLKINAGNSLSESMLGVRMLGYNSQDKVSKHITHIQYSLDCYSIAELLAHKAAGRCCPSPD